MSGTSRWCAPRGIPQYGKSEVRHPVSLSYYHADPYRAEYSQDAHTNVQNDERYQTKQWIQPHYNSVHQAFYSPANVRYIQNQILKHGFNQAPTFQTLQFHMAKVWQNDMLHAYDRLDPNRARKDQAYFDYYLKRLNRQLLADVMLHMQSYHTAQRRYLRDISQPTGVLEIVRPMYTECKSGGDPLRLDFLLPKK